MTRISRVGLGLGAVALAAATAFAVPAVAQSDRSGGQRSGCMNQARGGGPRAPFMRFSRMARQLGLSDAQKQEIRSIAQSHRVEWRGLAERAKTARQSLRQAETAAVVNDAAIREQASQLAAVQADMAVARAHAHAEFWKVLTPEQRAKAESLRTERAHQVG